jgi:hypothetical protein
MTSKTITHALACCPCSRVLFGASALSSLPQRGLASSSRRLSRASRLSLFGLLTLDACCNARSASARCASGGRGGGEGHGRRSRYSYRGPGSTLPSFSCSS